MRHFKLGSPGWFILHIIIISLTFWLGSVIRF